MNPLETLLSRRFGRAEGPNADYLTRGWLIDEKTNTHLAYDEDEKNYCLYRTYDDGDPDEPEHKHLITFCSDSAIIDYFDLIPVITCTTQGKRCDCCSGLIEYDEKVHYLPDHHNHITSIPVCSDCYELEQEYAVINNDDEVFFLSAFRLTKDFLHDSIAKYQRSARIMLQRNAPDYVLERLKKKVADIAAKNLSSKNS